MEPKYYTPTIEEFHVGFEHEVYIIGTRINEKASAWIAFKINELEDLLEYHNSMSIEGNLDAKYCRVKSLNREDIESENWKYSDNRKIDKPNHKIDISIFRRRKDNSFYYTLTIDNLDSQIEVSINQLNSGYRQVIFLGKLLNKSELKRIQKQLNIE